MPCRQVYSSIVLGLGGGGSTPDYVSPTHPNQWDDAQTTPVPFVCSLGIVRHLGIRLSAAPGVGKSWTFDLLKGPADDPLTLAETVYTVTISDTATYGELSDCLVLTDGDTYILRRTPSGGPSTSITTRTTLVVDQQTAYESQYGSSGQFLGTSSQTWRQPLLCGVRFHPDPTNVYGGGVCTMMPAAGDVTKYTIVLSAPVPVGSSWLIYARKANIIQNGSGGTVDTRLVLNPGDQIKSWTGTFPVDFSQCLWEAIYTGPIISPDAGFGVRFVADTDTHSVLSSSRMSNMPSAAGTYWARTNPYTLTPWEGTSESSEALYNDSPYSFTIKGLWPRIGGPFGPVPANPMTFSLRRNGSSPAGAPTITISTGSGVQDTTSTLTIDPADYWTMRNVQTGNAGLAKLATVSYEQIATATLYGTCLPADVGTLVVQKVLLNGDVTTEFDIAVGGGLLPANITLMDGEEQVYEDVPTGSGYSVSESSLPFGYELVSIVVSNGSPSNNISVATGETVTVVVTNQYVTAHCPGDAQGCLANLPIGSGGGVTGCDATLPYGGDCS